MASETTAGREPGSAGRGVSGAARDPQREARASRVEQKLEAGAQADAFRERIIQASTELIREQGLSALSMREVARRAGVSHQAPYYYFADREAILGAIAEQGFRVMGEYVQRSAPGAGEAPHAAILAAGRAYLDFAFEYPAHFRVMFRPELVTPERHPEMLGEGMRACDTFYRIVSGAVEAGLPAEPSVDALFLLCWSVVHGLACLVLDGPLDVVTPHVERQAQLRDVLSAFARMSEASIAQARLTAAPGGAGQRAGAAREAPSTPARARDTGGAAPRKAREERGTPHGASARRGAKKARGKGPAKKAGEGQR